MSCYYQHGLHRITCGALCVTVTFACRLALHYAMLSLLSCQLRTCFYSTALWLPGCSGLLCAEHAVLQWLVMTDVEQLRWHACQAWTCRAAAGVFLSLSASSQHCTTLSLFWQQMFLDFGSECKCSFPVVEPVCCWVSMGPGSSVGLVRGFWERVAC